MHISVKELWEAWLKSEVHNWTVEQTTEWLTTSVDLPQYVPSFITHKVTGANLPRFVFLIISQDHLSQTYSVGWPSTMSTTLTIWVLRTPFISKSLF